MATGNEILAYQGNSALSGDAGSVGQAVSPIDTSITTSFMDKFMDQQFRWNAMLYQQAIKDREDTYKMVAESQIDLPVEEYDRPIIQKKVDELKEVMLKTPNLKKDREQYAKAQGLLKEINALKVGAQNRTASISTQRLAAANELNPEKKARMMQHLESEIKKGPTHQIEPFNQMITWTPEELFAKEVLVPTTRRYTKGGITYKVTDQVASLDNIVGHYDREAIMRGEKTHLPYMIRDFYQHQSNNPDLLTPENIQAINAKIDAVNAENNTKGTPRFIQHVAEVRDGQVVVNPNAAEFTKAMDVYEHYRTISGTEAPDQDVMKARETLADIGLKGAQAYKARKDANSYAEQAHANAVKALAEGDKARYELETAKATGADAAGKSLQLFATESRATGYTPLSKALQKFPNMVNILTTMQGNIGVDGTWKAKDLGRGNSTAVKMLTVATVNDDGKKVISTPSRVVMVMPPDGNPNKAMIVGMGVNGEVLKVLDANQGGIELIRNNVGYVDDIKLQNAIGGYNIAWQDLQGDKTPGADVNTAMKRNAVVDNSTNTAPITGRRSMMGETPVVIVNDNTEMYDLQGNLFARKVDNVWVPVTTK